MNKTRMIVCENCKRPLESSYFPTEKERNIIKFIQDFQKNNKETPTFRQIGDYTQIKSSSGVHRYLHKLQDRGFLHLEIAKRRSITVLKGVD